MEIVGIYGDRQSSLKIYTNESTEVNKDSRETSPPWWVVLLVVFSTFRVDTEYLLQILWNTISPLRLPKTTRLKTQLKPYLTIMTKL